MIKKYCFDLDNTLCRTEGRDYENSTAIHHRIQKVNRLFDSGNYILIYTARGMGFFSGNIELIEKEYRELTESQLKDWGVRYNSLNFGKPSYDLMIDDKNLILEDFDRTGVEVVGFLAGSFDILHPGYVKMFKEAKLHCSKLVVGLHSDPSTQRPEKMKPLLSLAERREILESVRYVDAVIEYETENELKSLLDSVDPDIRFLGEDYNEKAYTTGKKEIPIVYISRSHGWSSTKLKSEIAKQFINK
jgi:glycerol-3-phosphate cytidylyltransferase